MLSEHCSLYVATVTSIFEAGSVPAVSWGDMTNAKIPEIFSRDKSKKNTTAEILAI